MEQAGNSEAQVLAICLGFRTLFNKSFIRVLGMDLLASFYHEEAHNLHRELHRLTSNQTSGGLTKDCSGKLQI